MKVAVVTPYHRENLPVLRRCHDSVLAQAHAATHFIVADGAARGEVDGWDVQHIRLPRAHGDYGNTPRAIGGMSALNQGFDAVAYLDADNHYAPDHIQSLAATCAETGCDVAFSYRHFVLASGEICPFDSGEDVERRHVDTSCMMFTAKAAFLLPMWGMIDPQLAVIGDRIMAEIIRKRGLHTAWSGRRTLFYETRLPAHYAAMGKPPPEQPHEVDWAEMRTVIARVRGRMAERFGFDIFPLPFKGGDEAAASFPRNEA